MHSERRLYVLPRLQEFNQNLLDFTIELTMKALFLLLSLAGFLSVAKARKRIPSKTIEEIILDQDRFVVFNSRHLTGECGKTILRNCLYVFFLAF